MKAFPRNIDYDKQDAQGMDLRDYFAAKAMHAMITKLVGKPNVCEVSGYAYEMADEMMMARDDVISEEAMMEKLFGDTDDSIS